MTDPVAALRDLATRIGALADHLEGDGFPSDDAGRAYGVRHATRQLVMALQSELEFGDACAPTLHTYEQPWVQWGGPNPDNVYQRCAIDPAGRYRLSGNVADIDNAIISLVDGDMHLGKFGVFSERTLKDLVVTDTGDLVIEIGPSEPDPSDAHGGENTGGRNWMPTDPAATMLLIRQYVSDWDTERPAILTIERIDADTSGPRPLTGAVVAEALGRAADWTEQSLTFWRAYADGARKRMPVNAPGPPATPPGGAPNIAYGAMWWALADGETLVLDLDRPDADYWSFTIHTRYWLDSGEFATRQTSLNHRQTFVDTDGRIRLVLCASDPQVPNWIDTSDHPEGMLVYRYVGARTRPVPTAVVVASTDVRANVPADHPAVTPPQRAAVLGRRRRSVLSR